MPANAISAINFFILVLSNVATKLLRTTFDLNKAKTSKNSNVHPLFCVLRPTAFPASVIKSFRASNLDFPWSLDLGAWDFETLVTTLNPNFALRTSDVELLRNACIQHRALRLTVLRLRIVSLGVILDLLTQTVGATKLLADLIRQIFRRCNLRAPFILSSPFARYRVQIVRNTRCELQIRIGVSILMHQHL